MLCGSVGQRNRKSASRLVFSLDVSLTTLTDATLLNGMGCHPSVLASHPGALHWLILPVHPILFASYQLTPLSARAKLEGTLVETMHPSTSARNLHHIHPTIAKPLTHFLERQPERRGRCITLIFCQLPLPLLEFEVHCRPCR